MECIKRVSLKGPMDNFVMRSGGGERLKSSKQDGESTYSLITSKDDVLGKSEVECFKGSECGEDTVQTLTRVAKETAVENGNVTKTLEGFARDNDGWDANEGRLRKQLKVDLKEKKEEGCVENLGLAETDVHGTHKDVGKVLEENVIEYVKVVDGDGNNGNQVIQGQKVKSSKGMAESKSLSAKKKLKKRKKDVVDKNQPRISLFYGSTD